eukprot:gene2365-2924_t
MKFLTTLLILSVLSVNILNAQPSNSFGALYNGYLILRSSNDYNADHGVQNSIMNRPAGGGAGCWAPRDMNQNQFIMASQITRKYCQTFVVKGIGIQGRSDYDQWVTSFQIHYSLDGINWTTMTNPVSGNQVFTEESTAVYTPPIDVSETSNSFIIDLEFPGVSKNDISINFNDSKLIVEAKKQKSIRSFNNNIKLEVQMIEDKPKTIEENNDKQLSDNESTTSSSRSSNNTSKQQQTQQSLKTEKKRLHLYKQIPTPPPSSPSLDHPEIPILTKEVLIKGDAPIQMIQDEIEKENNRVSPLFHKIEYVYTGVVRLSNKDIARYSHQQLCLLGRLTKVVVEIQKPKDIRVLEYFKGTTTLKLLTIYVQNPVKIPKGLIPDTVEELNINLDIFEEDNPAFFKNLLEEGTIPSSVKFLSVDHALFRFNVKGLIPDTVQGIEIFNWSYIPGEKDIVPPNVKNIIIHKTGDDLTQLGALPRGITDLTMLYPFTQPISPGVLPDSLKHLKLSQISIPLEIGSLPSKLESFHVSGPFSPQDLVTKSGIFPDSLTRLQLNDASSNLNLDFLPKSSVTYLDIAVGAPLKNLKGLFDGSVQEFSKGILPSGLKILDITYCPLSTFNVDDIHIPTNIQLIEMNHTFATNPKLITKLFAQSESRLQLDLISMYERVTLLSTDPTDLYVYFNIKSSFREGFISKSNLPSILEILVNTVFITITEDNE